jgi:hypothetical protein
MISAASLSQRIESVLQRGRKILVVIPYNEERLVHRPKYGEGCSSTEGKPVPECHQFEFSWSMITNRFGNSYVRRKRGTPRLPLPIRHNALPIKTNVSGQFPVGDHAE